LPIDVARILSELDAEIARLQHIRATLSGTIGTPPAALGQKKRGRPKGSKNNVSAAPVKKSRVMSPEARKRIAEAQRKRWAAQKTS
jgi:hypothetical protein